MDEKDIDIFICTHVDFDPPVKSGVYKVLDARKLKANLPLDDKFYSELYVMKYVYDNIPLKKYVGFCQYRKYFSFMDDLSELDGLFNEYECVVASLTEFNEGGVVKDIRRQYATVGNAEDLFLSEGIVLNRFPDYYDTMRTYFDGNKLIAGDMFIMKSEDFRRYVEFIFGVLDGYLDTVGLDITQRIWRRRDVYLKTYFPNNTIEYQYRIGGQLVERLTGVFIFKNFKKVCAVGMTITENKYNQGEITGS